MSSKTILLEGCIETIQEADYYAQQGIDRFELCSNLNDGGLAPDCQLVDYCLNKLRIPSVVMLRLRPDFRFEPTDLAQYKKLIMQYKELGVTAFIFGFIKDKAIDIEACKALISLVKPAQCAFHMAIDEIQDYKHNIPLLIKLGFDWVLTKGGARPASENLDTLTQLIKTYEPQIKILVGGKVTKDNWSFLHEQTNATWFHGRKIK